MVIYTWGESVTRAKRLADQEAGMKAAEACSSQDRPCREPHGVPGRRLASGLLPSLQLDPVHPASQRQPAAKTRPRKPGEGRAGLGP